MYTISALLLDGKSTDERLGYLVGSYTKPSVAPRIVLELPTLALGNANKANDMRMNWSPPRRILLLEDDEFLIMDLEVTLPESGYDTVSASTVADALRGIERNSLDAALLDVNLFGFEHSFAVADVLATAGIPFAFITGRSASYLPPRFRHVPIVPKPYEVSEVLTVLARLVERSHTDCPG